VSGYNSIRWRNAIGDHPTLGKNGKQVALILDTYADFKTGQCRPSVARMAERWSLGEATVKRGLAELRGIGAIKVLRSGKGRGSKFATEYQLQMPGIWLTMSLDMAHSELTTNQELKEPGSEDQGVDMAHSEPYKVAEDLESSPALDLSSKAIECPHPSCKHRFPVGLSLDSPGFDAVFKQHYKQHEPNPVASKPAPARPPGLRAPARKPVNKWECSQCGGQFSYLGKGEPSERMCKRCKLQIEG
jgi:hypothetical protein